MKEMRAGRGSDRRGLRMTELRGRVFVVVYLWGGTSQAGLPACEEEGILG